MGAHLTLEQRRRVRRLKTSRITKKLWRSRKYLGEGGHTSPLFGGIARRNMYIHLGKRDRATFIEPPFKALDKTPGGNKVVQQGASDLEQRVHILWPHEPHALIRAYLHPGCVAGFSFDCENRLNSPTIRSQPMRILEYLPQAQT